MNPRWQERLKRQFATSLDLPEQIVLDYAIIKLVGKEEVIISNHRGLVTYTPECIKARADRGFIKITGANLVIPSFSANEIKIKGIIQQVILT